MILLNWTPKRVLAHSAVPQIPFALLQVMAAAEQTKVFNLVRAASRERNSVVDLQVVTGRAAPASGNVLTSTTALSPY